MKRFPWDEWCDGEVHEARVGEDFRGTPQSFVRHLRHTGNTRGRALVVLDATVESVRFRFEPRETPA